MEYKNIKVNSWVSQKLTELKKQKHRNRVSYIILVSLLTIVNLSTVILAAIAIDMLITRSSGKTTAIILSSLSAGFIIILFVLHNINVIYKGIMKDKKYKKAMDEIQHEVMIYKVNPEVYKGKNKEEQLETNVKAIYKKALKKSRKKSFPLFLRAFTGGENV